LNRSNIFKMYSVCPVSHVFHSQPLCVLSTNNCHMTRTLFVFRSTAGTTRTPSYQGLKFLTFSDIFHLKETAILSDSDPESNDSLHSLPGLIITQETKLIL
jgi:hypothetical protein